MFGRSFLAGTQLADGGPPTKSFAFSPGADMAATAKTAADQLAQEPEPRVIRVGASSEPIDAILKAIRRRGIASVVISAGGAASEDFLKGFANEPEEEQTPGYFVDNFYAAAALIFDSAGATAQAFARTYEQQNGRRPSFISAQSNDAARIMVEALRRAHPTNAPESKQADREAVRAALAAMDSPERGVAGLDGSLYFNANHDMNRPLWLGFFRDGRLVSAPLQLLAVQHPELEQLNEEIAQRHMVTFGGQYFWLQRVVYTGIDINQLNRVDVRNGRFNVDFYLWMRYPGDDDMPTQIEFADMDVADSAGAPFDADKRLEAGRQDDLRYRLYRVQANFGADFDLHDYPFDRQNLLIRMRNARASRERISYVVDLFGLQLDTGGDPPAKRDAFRGLQLWRVDEVRHFVSSFVNRSTLGKTQFFHTSVRNEYPVFDAAIMLHRDSVAFMVKTLMPLFLLVLVVFATLFFPPSLAKERTTIPVTGILTSAVLMISINSQLPPIGYSVSIEFVFYVFFALCLMAMVSGFVKEIERERGHKMAALVTDIAARTLYAIVALTTLAYFCWRYGFAQVAMPSNT